MAMVVVLFKTDLYPAVRTTQRQKFRDPAYAKYHAAKQQIAFAARLAMDDQGVEAFEREPLRLALFVNMPGGMHRRDLSNVLKGVEDGLQHIIYANDAWMDQIFTTRAQVPDREQRAVAVIQPISEGPVSFLHWLNMAAQQAHDQGVIVEC